MQPAQLEDPFVTVCKEAFSTKPQASIFHQEDLLFRDYRGVQEMLSEACPIK